jgi:hypothetical protein
MQHRTRSIAAAFLFAAVSGCSDATTQPTTQSLAPAAPTLAKRTLGSQFTTTIDQTVAGVSSIVGTLTVTGFTVVNGQLAAVGTLTAQVTNLITGATQNITQTVTVPMTASGSCQVLHLELGPLDLDLLGLQIHLDRIVLDITAQSGPGNLVGNLLCAITNLLNSGALLTQVSALLNQLLGLLG